MSYTVGNLVEETLGLLEGTASDEYNVLKTSLSAQATDFIDTVSLTYSLNGCVEGVYLSIEDEMVYVLDVNDENNSATVFRGQKNSPAVAHSANVKILVDPPWPRWVVMQTLKEEIRSWGPQVYQICTTTINMQAGIRGYDLGDPGPVYERVRVYRDPPPFIGEIGAAWSGIGVPSNQSWPSIPADLRQNQSTKDFPSGNALILRTNQITVPSTVWVVYSKPFDVDSQWSDDTDVVDTVGLDTSDLDIPPYGVAWRLLSFKQPRRLLTNIAGQPRDASDVPPLSLMQAALQFKETRDSRLNDAQIRLLQKFQIEVNVS